MANENCAVASHRSAPLVNRRLPLQVDMNSASSLEHQEVRTLFH